MFLRMGKFRVQINYFMNEQNKNKKKLMNLFRVRSGYRKQSFLFQTRSPDTIAIIQIS